MGRQEVFIYIYSDSLTFYKYTSLFCPRSAVAASPVRVQRAPSRPYGLSRSLLCG